MNKTTFLFEQQSYLDTLTYYQEVLNKKKNTVCWDYVILTASNESQAEAYREQINWRLHRGQLPADTVYQVLPDPQGKRVGSGGATFNVLRYLRTREESFSGKRILVIHSGGDSKRIPQYSACGKLFSPVPRMLPEGRHSTLFDEFMIAMSPVAPRISEGMLVCSGDVLLLFNALQIDFYSQGAAALSIKENVETGCHHGVFLKDEKGNVGQFLHKQTQQTLTQLGAVNNHGKVDIDTGAVIFGTQMLEDLYALIATDEGFEEFVNETAKISFYADFLYPLASESTLEQFYKEQPEGEFTPQLHQCRTKLWNVLHKYDMKLIQLSPASFIHFGTTAELLALMTKDIEQYLFLGWSRAICSNVENPDYGVCNSYISRSAEVAPGCYVEDSYIHSGTRIGPGAILSGVTLQGESVPGGVVLHGLKLKNGKFVVRIYGVEDNPKEAVLLGKPLSQPLWTEKLYPVCDSIAQAVEASIASVLEGCRDLPYEKLSLQESFSQADTKTILPWQEKISDKVIAESILQAIDDGISVEEVCRQHLEITPRTCGHLLNEAESLSQVQSTKDFGRKIRIYYYLHCLTGKQQYADTCFKIICDTILEKAIAGVRHNPDCRIVEEETVVQLPVRVNWGGGWSDTPPYCIEHGGAVLNAAVSFDGKLPIEVTLRRVQKQAIILASTDIGSYREFTDIAQLQDCNNPHDPFALHKAALIACGVIPAQEEISVSQLCEQLGGGFYMNTRVVNIPKGSGLGTSSILAGACVKALCQFLGLSMENDDLYSRVLCMEQLMSTGGGWQDQVGGLCPGIKMVTSRSGLKQEIACTPVAVTPETLEELNQRFCLIYTGQRRLARNLLRKVVGKYIGNAQNSADMIYKMQRTAVLMRFELEKGNVDGFAQLLNTHWELSQKLDSGCTNTCIDQIFLSVEDLIDGKMICGAGGGGFLQVILKRGVSRQQLQDRLYEVFGDSGVDVWGCKFE